MSYTWFKLHHDLPDDIKLRRFTPQEKWAWVVLLCLASKSATRGVVVAEDDDIADYCEFNSTQDWLYYRDKLIAKGMLEIGGDGNVHILHWEDRQYDKPSDRPEAIKERVKKHRAKKKIAPKKASETPCNALQTQSNADVTPQTRLDKTRQDTDSEEIGVLDSLYLSNASDPEKEKGDSESLVLSSKSVNSKPLQNRPRREYNATARFERNFSQPKYPWTGNSDFEDWVGRQWNMKEKPTKTTIQTHILNCERNDLEKVELYWRNYQEERELGGKTSASEDVKSAIGRELRRLNRSSELPTDWQRRTGKALASELSATDATEYLSYLKTQEGAA